MYLIYDPILPLSYKALGDDYVFQMTVASRLSRLYYLILHETAVDLLPFNIQNSPKYKVAISNIKNILAFY